MSDKIKLPEIMVFSSIYDTCACIICDCLEFPENGRVIAVGRYLSSNVITETLFWESLPVLFPVVRS